MTDITYMTDREKALAARGGDKSAEELLLEKYTPLVKSIAAHFFLCGGEREDLVQEGMFGLYSAINTFDEQGGANFSAYAYVCIRNSIIGAVKKNNGDKYSALHNFVPLVEISDITAPDLEGEIIRRENRLEFLQKISKNLSSFEFKVTVMYTDGLGVQEIASALGKTGKSVSNAIARAKQKLLKIYSKES